MAEISLNNLQTQINGKAASTHTHTKSNITDFPTIPTSLPANGGTSAACSGNAATATKLQTARTINGVAFDGTTNITLPTSSDENLHGIKIFTANGTFTVPSNVTTVYVSMCGAGGGGGGGNDDVDYTYRGGGGGSGAWYVKQPVTVTAGSTITVTVGAAGAGATTAGGLGGTGGTSSFGSLLSCAGGAGGKGGSGGSGAQGASGFGNVAYNGGYQTVYGGHNPENGCYAPPFGMGGLGAYTLAASANPPKGYGSGGGGGYGNGTVKAGCAGTSGICIVEW